MRRWTTILAAILTLALPASTLAVTGSGTTTESLTGPATTVSLTVPASTTYLINGAKYDSGTITISNLSTNAVNGMHVDLTTSAFGGAASVPTTTRSRDTIVVPTGWTGGAARAAGFYATSATVDQLANRGNPPASPVSFDVLMHTQSADFTVQNGAYTGTLSFSAVTNP